MNDTPVISVIVPMYNAEKYLRTCVDSILNQTFTDFELILVDDCSTDKTLEIAKSFSDPRIKILQTEKNSGGPGVPRNMGIDAARGEFLYFMDNDDAIAYSTLKIFYDKIIASEADIVYNCTWVIPTDPEFTELNGLKGKAMSTENNSVFKDLKKRIWTELCEHRMHSVLWLCLYRKKLFDNGEEKIRFPNCLAEDVFVHLDLLCATYKILKIKTPLYVYRTNSDSLTRAKKSIGVAVRSIFELIAHVRKKLSGLIDDEVYINRVCLSLMNGVATTYLKPSYLEDSNATFHELEDHFKDSLGERGSELAFLFYAYLWGQNQSVQLSRFQNELKKILKKANDGEL